MSHYVQLSLEQAAALTSDAWESDPRTPTLWLGPPGIGKCLGHGVPVMLASGRVVAVETVKVGDQLMGPDSKPRRVLSTTSGVGPLFRIDPKKGQPWVCNDVHVLTLVHSETDEVFDMPLDEYLRQAKSRKRHQKQFHVAVDFPGALAPSQLPVNPYFLGVWLGDGAKQLSATTGQLTGVRISKPDPEIRQLCLDTAAAWGLEVSESDSDGARCPTYRIIGAGKEQNRLLDALREVVGANCNVPHAYLCASREARLQLLAGLLDTDGHLISNCYEFVQKRESIAAAAFRLARSLGLQATHSVKSVAGYGEFHRLHISGNVHEIPCRIPRKKAAPRRQEKDVTRTGFTVEPIGEGDYFGFTLDGDGRFLLGDCTVTHNTERMAMLAEQTGRILAPHEVAHSADEDVGGIPVRDPATGSIVRLPLGPLNMACYRPAVYFGDEISRASAQKQGCLLTIANEGRAGDFKLHAETRVAFAANGTDSAGAHQIIDTLINRCLVVDVRADVAEVKNYLRTRVGAEGSPLRELAIDFAATAEKAADLIQADPPEGAAESGRPWASPRAIVKALKVFDTGLRNGRTGDVLFAGLAGLIGKESAGAYLAIRKIREHLPSVDEIVTNPNGAKVPDAGNLEANIGTLGLVGIAASRNPDSAWLYAARMQSREVGQAMTRSMLKYPPKTQAGHAAKFALMGKAGEAIRGNA